MPPRTRTTGNPTPNGPAKKAAPKRPRRAAPSIAEKRAQIRAEDSDTLDPYALTGWGAQDSVGTLTDLDLPSGQRVLIQRPKPEDLLIAGLLDDLDMLAGLIPDPNNPRKKAGVDNAKLNAISKDPKGVRQAIILMDRLMVHAVVKPELTPEPENPSHKEIGKIYPSSVSMEDKMFIFNWALGGTRDLAKFRQQLASSMEDVAAVEDVE